MIGVVGATGLIGKRIQPSIQITSRFENSIDHIRQELLNKQVQVLISAAGNSNASSYNLQNFQDELIFNFKLVDVLSQFPLARLLYISTSHVYGNTPKTLLVSEAEECNPITEYGKRKLELEELISKYASEKDLPIIACRVFSIFEKGMKPNFLAGRIESEIASGERKISIDHSDDLRDFNSSSEIGFFLEQIAQRFVSCDGSQSQILNIGSGIPRSVREIVVETFQGEAEFQFNPGHSTLPSLVADTSRLAGFLGE